MKLEQRIIKAAIAWLLDDQEIYDWTEASGELAAAVNLYLEWLREHPDKAKELGVQLAGKNTTITFGGQDIK